MRGTDHPDPPNDSRPLVHTVYLTRVQHIVLNAVLEETIVHLFWYASHDWQLQKAEPAFQPIEKALRIFPYTLEPLARTFFLYGKKTAFLSARFEVSTGTGAT